MTTYLGKSCSFCLPRVPFVNCRQFMYSCNNGIKDLCRRCSFRYIDNSNISIDMLKDQVHLNKTGENLLLQNLYGFL